MCVSVDFQGKRESEIDRQIDDKVEWGEVGAGEGGEGRGGREGGREVVQLIQNPFRPQ